MPYAKHKKPLTTWFYLCEMSEKMNLIYSNKAVQRVLGLGKGAELMGKCHRTFWG